MDKRLIIYKNANDLSRKNNLYDVAYDYEKNIGKYQELQNTSDVDDGCKKLKIKKYAVLIEYFYNNKKVRDDYIIVFTTKEKLIKLFFKQKETTINLFNYGEVKVKRKVICKLFKNVSTIQQAAYTIGLGHEYQID